MVLAMVLLVPTIAVGSHDYVDVPDTNVFHEDISWLANAGVTLGCNPPTNDRFCPDDPVTRQQMAAFVRRAAENQVVDAGMLDGMDSDDFLGAMDTAANSMLLAGMAKDDIRTLTFADVQALQGPGVIPTPGNGPIASMDFAVPVDGMILVTYSASVQGIAGATAYAIFPSLDDATCMDGFQTAAFGAVQGGGEYDSAGGVFPFDATAGSHTLTLCGSAQLTDLNLLNTHMGVVFDPGAVAPEIEIPPAMMSADGEGWR